MTHFATSEILQEKGLIAIIRGAFTYEQLLVTAEALVAGGITVIEITLNTPDALSSISYLKKRLVGRALVGAGTVKTKDHVNLALDAGATFLIAPNLDTESVARAQQRGSLLLPGVFTASEAQTAAHLGCPLVKLFPAHTLGPSYLKALRAPLDDIGFVPVGGIDTESLSVYVQAGAVAFGIGSSLVASPGEEPSELVARAQKFVAALDHARAS